MLASVTDGWLWLLAAAATVIHCSAMARWIPDRNFRVAYPVIVVGCGLGAMAIGRVEGFSLAAMIALYASSLIGLTIGLFPSRKLITMYAVEVQRGVRREKYDFPLWHRLFWCVPVVGMTLAAFALTH